MFLTGNTAKEHEGKNFAFFANGQKFEIDNEVHVSLKAITLHFTGKIVNNPFQIEIVDLVDGYKKYEPLKKVKG